MTTVYYTASSLDGFLADAEGSLGWLFQFDEPDGGAGGYHTFIQGVGAVAMGATTYEWLLDHERFLETPAAWPYDVPVWVFSHREQPAVPGADLRLVSGDVGPVHTAMGEAAGDRDVWLVGGGDLVGQFHDEGLLEEIRVTVAPVTLGAGAPLLPRRIANPPLRLVGVERSGEAFVTLTYAVRRATEE